MCVGMLKGANVGTQGYAGLTIAAANLILAHGSDEQKSRYAEPMLAGRFFGTMCLTEPHAGSSLGDLRTRAEPQADGSYRLFGNKIYISGGDHELSENIIHMVLARLPGAPAGVKGISLFLVPKVLVNEDGSLGERNDVALAGLIHIMGYRGPPCWWIKKKVGRWSWTVLPGRYCGGVRNSALKHLTLSP